MSTKDQKAKIAQLAAVIGQPDSYCKQLLVDADWSVEGATDAHFSEPPARSSAKSSSSSSASATAVGSAAAEADFKRFQSPSDEPGKLGLEGVEAFAAELGIDPFSDPLMLFILQQMGCTEQGSIRREEFLLGMGKMGASSVAALKGRLSSFRADLASNKNDAFASLWTWSYTFSCEPGQKSLAHEIASGLASMLLTEERWPLAPAFNAWMASHTKTLSKDTWRQLLRYQQTVRSLSFEGHDDDSAFPSALDDFKAWTLATVAKKGVDAFKLMPGGGSSASSAAGAGGK